jgi:DNA-binding NtrC family response regulator
MEPTRLQPCDVNSSTRTTRRHDAEAAPPLGQGRPAQNEPAVADGILGRSPAFVSLLRGLVEVAAFTTASILLLGESGTGKEQLGRLVHALDPRAGKRELVTLDCTTVAPELAPSEFFGHERGAFTGAVAARDGAFHRADGGTLFLDEVGELPLPLQAQLLRIVQEGTYKRVGGNDWLATRFRLVAATNRSLADEVERERFRLDFFHRLTTWTFRGPPLRERPEDIVPLARHFARQSAGPGGAPDIDERVQQFLIRRAYPGNVRELKQLIGRICSRHVAPGPITIGDVPPEDLAGLELAGEILHESRRRSGRAAWSCRSRARSRAIRRRGRFESVSASTTPATNRAGWNACKASARARANSLVPRPRPLNRWSTPSHASVGGGGALRSALWTFASPSAAARMPADVHKILGSPAELSRRVAIDAQEYERSTAELVDGRGIDVVRVGADRLVATHAKLGAPPSDHRR